jgi:hypothetical protein
LPKYREQISRMREAITQILGWVGRCLWHLCWSHLLLCLDIFFSRTIWWPLCIIIIIAPVTSFYALLFSLYNYCCTK